MNPNQQLAEDLRIAKDLAQENIIQSNKLPRMVFQRLKQKRWLSEIMRGWYILKTPHAEDGESTLWYANFWTFLRLYLNENYQSSYCLSPQYSLYVKTESGMIPNQVIVILKEGGHFQLSLPFGTSVLLYPDKVNFPTDIDQWNGLNIVSLPKALTMMPENFFSTYETEAEIALNMIKSPGELTRHLVEPPQPTKSDLLAGAYEFLGKEDFVKQIGRDMELIGHKVRPKNPFVKEKPSLSVSRIESPAVLRVALLWEKYRNIAIHHFPEPKHEAKNADQMLQRVQQIYVHDAYNSLSIEGYAVTDELIRRVASNDFNPDINPEDKQQEAAMAAKGYFLAFKEVSGFIKNNFGRNINDVRFREEIQTWYQNLFRPKVDAGLATPKLLLGYRDKPVYIRNSMHTPVNFSFVNQVMDKYLELLDGEESPKAKALLAHFMLVYIHPYSDGNGRTARFLMNAILTLSGYNWTVIQLANKTRYFKTLEKASTNKGIEDFAHFIAEEMAASEKWQAGHRPV